MQGLRDSKLVMRIVIDSRVLREPPSQSLKLHDADVIERFAIYYLDKTGSNIGFGAENYARRLRNSVKEGEQNDN